MLTLSPDKNAKVFKALGDEKRLTILELLRGGEKCACVLIEQLKIGQSSLSYHMKILCESGLVESRPEGKWTHYKINEQGSSDAVLLLKAITAPNPADDEAIQKGGCNDGVV